MEPKRIQAPLTDEVVMTLKAGDNVLISGVIYTARDAAHKKLVELMDKGEPLPIDLNGQFIYYVGRLRPNLARRSDRPDRRPVGGWMPIHR
jgi:fumarate hydratase subunit beta